MTPGDMRDSIALSVSLPLCSFEDVYKEHSPFMIQYPIGSFLGSACEDSALWGSPLLRFSPALLCWYLG